MEFLLSAVAVVVVVFFVWFNTVNYRSQFRAAVEELGMVGVKDMAFDPACKKIYSAREYAFFVAVAYFTGRMIERNGAKQEAFANALTRGHVWVKHKTMRESIYGNIVMSASHRLEAHNIKV